MNKSVHKQVMALLLVACLSVGILTGCGNSSNQVTTDHTMPEDISNTTMGDTSGSLPIDYNEMEGSLPLDSGETESDMSVQPEEDTQVLPEGDNPEAIDGEDELSVSGEEEVPADDATIDDEGIPTLEIPDGVDVVNEIVNLERTIPEMADVVPTAPGTDVISNDYASIDYTNSVKGYVVTQYTDPAETARLKCIVQGPSVSYNYNLTAGKQEVLPLSDGNGTYKITVYRNISGDRYATILSADINVTMESEFAPFLNSNQYVDFYSAPNSVLKATSLCSDLDDPLEKVAAVYDFVVKNISYDTEKAASVQSGYLPVLDDVLSSGKGICFDYAALMTGMLRSQNVPCKLVVGYAGGVYHAWISVWSDEMGWVEGFVYFDGITWQRMDPTFDSNAGGSDSVREFIGNGSNYSVKYLY